MEFSALTVPSGVVTMSDRRTQRTWSVDVSAFLLAATPVTQAMYETVTGHRPSSDRDHHRPMECVSWWDAVQFCNELSDRDGLSRAYEIDPRAEHALWLANTDGWRLPSEAEWEHACRAGSTAPRYGELDEIAWHRNNSGNRSHSVAGKRPNPWGLYDMLGNVWEWCWDLYDAEVYGTYRVLRGGGWYDEHWSCRAGVRRRSHPTFRIDDVGFRIGRNQPIVVAELPWSARTDCLRR